MRSSIAALMILAGTAGCGTSLDAFPGLGEQIANYYEHEKQQNWRETWTYRVPIYRQSVPLERYVATMNRDAKGWTLKEAKVRRVIKQGDLVKVDIDCVEIPPKDWRGSPVPLDEVTIED